MHCDLNTQATKSLATTLIVCSRCVYVRKLFYVWMLQHGHPYISAMVNNGSFHYDHDRDGTHTAIDGCEAGFRLAEHDTFIAIRYERNRLMVSLMEKYAS